MINMLLLDISGRVLSAQLRYTMIMGFLKNDMAKWIGLGLTCLTLLVGSIVFGFNKIDEAKTFAADKDREVMIHIEKHYSSKEENIQCKEKINSIKEDISEIKSDIKQILNNQRK